MLSPAMASFKLVKARRQAWPAVECFDSVVYEKVQSLQQAAYRLSALQQLVNALLAVVNCET